MSQKVRDRIRDFQYNLLDEDHCKFLDAAFDVGLLLQSLASYILENGIDEEDCRHGIETFLQGEDLRAVSLVAHNSTHRQFAYYGLRIGLFPVAFLDYLKNGLSSKDFSSEDSNSVQLLMQAVWRAVREAFRLPATQIEVSRKKNFTQSMGQKTVKIIVGDGEGAKEFVVHRDILMSKVSFFENMFSSEFLESSGGLATLPKDSPEAFEVLIEWVYCSTLNPLHKSGNPDPYLADLAISTIGLAEKYMIPELGDRAMSFLAEVGEDLVPTMSQMSTLYEQTSFNSKARVYAARTVAWALVNPETNGVSSVSIQSACQDSDLLLDAITEVRGTRGCDRDRAHEYPVCDYHNHAAALECPYEGHDQTANQRNQNNQNSKHNKHNKQSGQSKHK